MRFFFLVVWCFSTLTSAFALTPFSLEGLKSVNVKIFDKDQTLSKTSLEGLTQELEKKLQTLGIQTSAKTFSNLIVKIQAIKGEKMTVCHVAFSLVENVHFTRDQEAQGIAIVYAQDDFFESDEPQNDVIDSIKFLLDEFLEQYKQEK